MRFGAIEADTPNLFATYSEKGRGKSPKYPVMTWEQICALPVKDVAADDCALFLWTSRPFLLKSIEVAHAWGFRYSSWVFTWTKLTKRGKRWHWGTGYSSRAQTEKVLLFFRGHPKRLHADVPEIVEAPVTAHSEKPVEVKRRIERLYEGPFLDLFARRQEPGWTCIGEEVTGNSITVDLAALLAAG